MQIVVSKGSTNFGRGVESLFLVKMLTFYKCYVTFFRRNEFKLQIILYLCTLEIVPLLAFWGALVTTANNLKINF